MTTYDAIVVGVGGMGAATCLELARRGARVLGLERFALVHEKGSSHGESRIIRKAYFEHPDYVPLLHRAYDLWKQLESATGRSLLVQTGLVLSGPVNGETIQGARLSASQHGLELQNLDPHDAKKWFPGIEFPHNHAVAFEPVAGTLRVEDCVRAHVDEAKRLGATIRDNEPILEWTTDGQTVRVRTALGEYASQKLIVTAGAWANEILADIGVKFQVLRKFVGWFPVRMGEYSAWAGIPTYFFELPDGAFYGFPSFDGKSVKVAEHSGGESVCDPLAVDRSCHPHDLARLRMFLKTYLPRVGLNLIHHSICLYTMTPDKHFVIDKHPRWANVFFAAGFSGHGFKFCPVVGEVLADLTEKGATALPIGFLSLSRFDLRAREMQKTN